MSLRIHNREIPKLMTDRAQHRKASRRGQRLVRKRLANQNNTLIEFSNSCKLPEYKESRFNNRKRSVRYQGKSFVLTILLSKGLYYRTFGQGKKNFPAKECKILGRRSLVYM